MAAVFHSHREAARSVVVPVIFWLTTVLFTPAVPASEIPTVLCHFACSDFSYDNSERAKTYAELTQTKLAELPQASWIEREQLNVALQELQLSAWNPGSAANALQIGKFVSAELAIVGRFVKAETSPWTLHIEIIDLQKADVLATESIEIASEAVTKPFSVLPQNDDAEETVATLPIREADAKATAKTIRRLYHAALKAREARQKRIQVAVLHFRNEAPATRLDFLEADLLAAFAKLNVTDTDQDSLLHILRFPRAANAIEEAELLADGLAERISGESRMADYFLWGQYREIESGDVPFPEVDVELELILWSGIGEPQSHRLQTKACDLQSMIDEAIGIVKRNATQAATRELDTAHRQRLSQQLLRRAFELNKNTHRNPSQQQVVRLQNQKLKLLGAAAMFDVNNASIRRELTLQANTYVTYPPTKREDFFRRFKEFSDWRHYADKFGNATQFDYSHLAYIPQRADQRVVALEPNLLAVLMASTSAIPKSWTYSRAPKDVPTEVVNQWYKMFVEEYANALADALQLEAEFRSVNLFAGRLLDVVDYVDPPKLRGELIARLMKRMPETNNLSLLAEAEAGRLREQNDRIIEALHAIGQPQLVDDLRETLKAGNPQGGRMAKPYLSPYQQKKLADKQAEASGDIKPKVSSKRTMVAEVPVVEVPLRPLILPKDQWPQTYRANSVTFVRGHLWVGINESKYQFKGDRTIRIAVDEEPAKVEPLPLRHDSFGRLLELDDQIWIASLGIGIERIEHATSDGEEATLGTQTLFTPRDGLPTEYIHALVSDGENVYAGGGFNNVGALGRYDLKSQTWSKIDLPQHEWGDRTVDAVEVEFIAVGAGKIACYGSLNNRILVRDKNGGDWSNVTELVLQVHPELSFAQKHRLDVRGMHFADGLLWIASRKGIVAVDLNQRKVAVMVPTKFEITAIAPEGDHLWIGGSGSRLVRFDRKTREFDVRIHIPRKYPGAPTSICATNDRVWYGLDQGKCIVMEVDITEVSRDQ